MTETTSPLTSTQRAEILNRQVAKYVSSGWGVESISDTQAVLVKTKRMGWFFNTILTIFTAGFWLIYVAYRALNRKRNRMVLFVTEAGKVQKR